MLEVKNVFYRYGSDNSVLKDISFSVKEGDWLTIMGANASGKTTLAMTLNGLLLPDDGSVVVDGKDTRDATALGEIRKAIAFVFQNPDNQIVGATVEEDVAFGPCNLALPREEVQRRVNHSLELLNLTSYREHSPHMLSGGQKQKLALAGALAMEPRYLILDETCSMLDPVSRGEIWESVQDLHEKLGITVINISHFPAESLLGNRLMLLNHGRVEAQLCL